MRALEVEMVEQATVEPPVGDVPEEVVPRELAPVAPGDKGLPWLGRIFDYAKSPIDFFRHQWDTYGEVSPFYATGRTGAVILGPDGCDEVLRNRHKAFASGPAWGEIVGPFFDRGLMLLDFDEHHVHRRIMQEAFTRDRLAVYTERMQPAIAAGMADWNTDPRFPSYWRLKELTLDIAADIFMGGAKETSHAEMNQVNKAFIDCVQAAAGIVRADVPFTRWGRAFRSRKVLEDFLRKYLPAKRARLTDDFFSVLCHIETDDGERFSDDDVINHMIFLMMAAHDTSTITTSTMLQYLGQHPEWQERCREEALALGDAPTMAEIEGLQAADWVMKEALRLRAPVPAIVRHTVKDVVVRGVRIPADTQCMVGIQFSHLMEDHWTNPNVFDPERFSPARREDKSHRMAWEPFGGGVHKCIGLYFAGLEVKSILHRLLRDYRWTVDPAYVAPLDNHSLPFPKDGNPINLTRITAGGRR
ncbi:MAG: cytochrome P450 [Nocardioidaceae bacterium]|nr:cytochrome P450 [Nocardioidaceae bacterium]MCL2612436.1 cytochrome P450 [Nocardioidaceae bacterium]